MNDHVESCEIVAIEIEKLNVINIVIYRPPDTDSTTFTRVMNKVKHILSVMDSPEPTVLITGDFNFRFIEWERNEEGACAWKKKTTDHGTIDQQKQFGKMLEVVEKFHLIQTVEEATRNENTLDLVFTNNKDIISELDVSNTIMSDHNLIEITTNIRDCNGQITNTEDKAEVEDDLRQLNFHHEKVSWEEIKELIREMPWAELFEGKNNEECTEIFIYFIKKICAWKIPKKKNKFRNHIPKERKTLLNRIKMIKRKKHKERNKTKVKNMEKSIIEAEIKLKEHREQERNTMENKVIDNMKENPKALFDYIRRQKDKDTKIGPFKKGKEYIYDAKEICKMLIEQYNSQFSERIENMKITEEEINNIEEGDLVDIIFNEEDISNAISKLKKNSAAGPDGIPAIFLINTKEYIKAPLKIILRKSLDEGVLPAIFKMAYVTPLHKGGSKMDPANYRPISLTSHVMKVFERVIKSYLLKHLESNGLIQNNQHGFVSGRSTQTQLMQHYCDVFDALQEDVRFDTVYLDFAKAFDKVNHQILIKKLMKHKIKGKLISWINNFLCKRKYCVVANGVMSDEHDVLSGVPQGTVLASLFFIVMIADIDQNLENSVSRLFADDTKVSAKIKTKEDTERLQHDLEKIYTWADENLMQFNENKFEQMSHGVTKGVGKGIYKTKSGQIIKENKTVKDLGILTSKDVSFSDHIDDLVLSSKIKAGLLLRTFKTREAKPMMKMFNSFIRNKLDSHLGGNQKHITFDFFFS